MNFIQKSIFITLGATNAGRMLRLEDVPVFVGQNINIRATNNNNASDLTAAGVNRVITSITFSRTSAGFVDANSGVVQIGFNTALNTNNGGVLGATDSYTGVTLRGVDNAVSFNCDNASLVLYKLGNPPKVGEITYTEYSTEEHTAGGVTNFQRQFQCEPEAMNLYIFKADEQHSKNEPNGIQNYRLRIDQEDATDRDVVYRSPLYYDRLNATLNNSKHSVENLDEESREIDVANTRTTQAYYQQANKSLVCVANPLPITPTEKLVQVNIVSAAATLNNVNLYKELLKTI